MKTGLKSIERCSDERLLTQPPRARKCFHRGESSGVPPSVSVQGYQYLVDFETGAPIRFHWVSKDKTCSCGDLGCEAIDVVRQHLQAGGQRAPEPLDPAACPICGGKTHRDRNWDGKYTKEPGWRCEKGGLRHFLEAKAERIKKQLAENPWLFLPVPGYTGVRRDEVMTWEE